MDSIGSYQGIFNQSSITTDASELIITGLIDNKVIGSIGGILTNNVSTDGLDEGKTNLYYTDTRARNALTGGTSIIYYPLTGQINTSQALDTNSSPQFARIINSSLGTFSVIQGTNAGNAFTGDRCVLIGDSVMTATSSAQQSTAIGNSALGFATGNFNTAVGANAGFLVSTGTTNTIIGTNAGRGATPLTTGSNNVLLGAGANTSSSSSNNEIVIGFGVGAGNNTAKIYASNGLYVSNLTNGVLKATSGLITSDATTDDLAEGKTNLYFTNARAQGAFSAGTNITLSSGVIATSNNPTFSVGATIGTLNITNMNSNISNGLSLGSSAGTSGGFNVYLGQQAGGSATGSNNVGIGYQALAGSTGSNCFGLGFTAGFNSKTSGNVCIGNSTGQNLLTGSGYNIYIGSGSPSSSSASYEIVIGGSPAGVVGKGDSTCFISAGSGLYVSNLSNGVLKSSASGLITSNATTDDLTEGKTNLYFTTGRARGAITASQPIFIISGIISLGYNTSNLKLTGSNLDTIQDIATSSSPQFARLDVSSLGTNNIAYTDGVNLTSGSNGNCILGALSGDSITSGGRNIALGFTTMSGGMTPLTNANGHNIAVGTGALNVLEGIAQYNLAIGAYAGQHLTTSNYNIFYGYQAGNSVSTSSNNIAIGNNAIGLGGTKLTTTDGQNIAIGNSSAYKLNGTASNNISIGFNAMYNATSPSDNIILGTNAGNSISTSGGNIAIGGGSLSTGFAPLSGNGRNTTIGVGAGLYLAGNAQYNIMVGEYAGFNNSTSSSNIYLGRYTQGSSSVVANEIVISTKGDSSAPITGKGANTALIDARAGLYYYSPATCFLYATNFSNGRCQWANYAPNNPINGFYLTDYGNGANTVIVPTTPGLYQIDVSGTVLGSGSSIFGTWNNVNIRNYTHFLQSFSTNGIAYQVGFSVQSRPYTVVNLSGFELQWTGATYYGGLPIFVSIRFISL